MCMCSRCGTSITIKTTAHLLQRSILAHQTLVGCCNVAMYFCQRVVALIHCLWVCGYTCAHTDTGHAHHTPPTYLTGNLGIDNSCIGLRVNNSFMTRSKASSVIDSVDHQQSAITTNTSHNMHQTCCRAATSCSSS